MKKTLMAMVVAVTVMVAGNVQAGGFASILGKTFAVGVAGDVIDAAGRTASAGGDWAQEKIHGGQYKTYVQGDLESDSFNKVDKVTTGRDAVVSVGSVSLNNSRFNDDVTFDIDNRVGTIRAEDESYVDIGNVNFSNTYVDGETEVTTNNRINGGVKAGRGSVVRIGGFQSF